MVNITQIHRTIYLQCAIAGIFSLLVLIGFDKITALSLFIGGMIAVLGSVIYRVVAYRKKAYVAPALLIKRHYVAEGLKIGLTIILFALTFLFFPKMVPLALLLGYILAITAYWLGLIWKFGDS